MICGEAEVLDALLMYSEAREPLILLNLTISLTFESCTAAMSTDDKSVQFKSEKICEALLSLERTCYGVLTVHDSSGCCCGLSGRLSKLWSVMGKEFSLKHVRLPRRQAAPHNR